MVAETPENKAKEFARRKRERIIILITLLVVAAITYLETQVVHLTGDQPLSASILVFALININALLLLLLIFLVLRNLVKLMMERRQGVLGSRLRTKLVMAFVLLSLAPTILLFFAAFQFVGTSIEYWFNAQVERSLYDALEVSDAYDHQIAEGAIHFAQVVAGELGQDKKFPGKESGKLKEFIESRRSLFDLAAIRVFDPELKELAFATQSGTHIGHLQSFHLDLVKRAMTDNQPQYEIQKAPTGDFVGAVHPVAGKSSSGDPRVLGAAAVFELLPPGSLARAEAITKGLEGYRQLKAFKQPIKTNHFITLSIVTLLIVFAATWFGFYLAKTITVPIGELAQGTQRIAEGDYNFFIDQEGPDEIGTLVNAFNRMTADLKISKARLDEAQREMQRTNQELEQRRRYMEMVLRNVAAGVISVDAGGVITTFNPSAERLLKAPAGVVLGQNWRDILSLRQRDMVERMVMSLPSGSHGTVTKQLRLSVGGEYLTLMVHLGFLRDEAGQDLGMVVVFEDLTELEKAQRMAAWREVARRIAHEVKNPLTPIKLSAQRLIRRYQTRLGEEETVFDECTSTIVRQVEELQRLVSEFSTFARLPTARLAPGDLAAICKDNLTLFKGAHPGISFELEAENQIPVFDLDSEQMSRVLINLLDNAVAAVEDGPEAGQITVRLSYDDILKMARLELEDNGPGVPTEDRLRLFEPYFSTKRGGTGLGLAIVSTIVADHNGYIRVQDNQPRGTRIIIELPARGVRPGAQEAV